MRRYVKALKEGAQSAASEAERQEYGAQAERLYSRTETLMQRWASAFKVTPHASVVSPSQEHMHPVYSVPR